MVGGFLKIPIFKTTVSLDLVRKAFANLLLLNWSDPENVKMTQACLFFFSSEAIPVWYQRLNPLFENCLYRWVSMFSVYIRICVSLSLSLSIYLDPWEGVLCVPSDFSGHKTHFLSLQERHFLIIFPIDDLDAVILGPMLLLETRINRLEEVMPFLYYLV